MIEIERTHREQIHNSTNPDFPYFMEIITVKEKDIITRYILVVDYFSENHNTADQYYSKVKGITDIVKVTIDKLYNPNNEVLKYFIKQMRYDADKYKFGEIKQ